MTMPSGLSQSPDPTPSSTLSGTAPTASEPYRFSQTAPEWMRGKTEAEVNAQAEQLAQLAMRGLQPQSQVQQPPPYQSAQQPTLPPDEYVTGQQVQTLGSQLVQQAGQAAYQAVNPALEMMANTNLQLLKDKFPTEFAKYGPEIYSTIANIPLERRTIDTLKLAVNVVRGNHLEELINERADQIAAQHPALRSSGANGTQLPPDTASPEAKLSDAQRTHLRRQGLTPQLIAETAQKMGMPVERWYELYGKNAIGEGA